VRRTGGCLCGAVRFDAAEPVRDVVVCHCRECRRWTGGAWPAAAAATDALEVRADAPLVWRDSPASETRARRGFCSACGSTLFWQAPGRDTISFGAGTLDDAGGLRVVAHIWVSQSAAWELPGAGAAIHARGLPRP
jgi:hypothetical protein